ncbi:thiamine-phosphate synthase [Planctomycetales bacterium]|nr:thiamine-phosphate synthase [Planctomycetales bacterium]
MLERLLDVNFNRAREGLRVVEDYARLVLESPTLTAALKNARHSLVAIARELDGGNFAAARDIAGDCGASIKADDETARASVAEVVRANLNRVAEALRVLAEYAKTVSPAAATALEQQRYEVYRWQAPLFADRDRRDRLRQARLYVLITTALAATDPLTVCREVVAGGADIVQLREKEMEDGEFYRLAAAAREICAGRALLVVNDRPHLALLANADGVHSGQGDLPPHLTRRIINNDRLLGVSTAAPDLAAKAARDFADYIGVGPVYPTNTKVHRRAVGLEYVRWAARHSPLPYFCIGGIKRDNLAEVLDAGARAVAVCTGIIAAPDIAGETAWFKERLKERAINN